MAQRSNPEDVPPNAKQTHDPVCIRIYHKPKIQATHRQRQVKTCTIKNGVPQSSVLAPMLFNIYTSNIPHTASTQYICADDIALMESGLNYADIHQTLTNDLTCLDLYLQRWRFRLNSEQLLSSDKLPGKPPDGRWLRRENDPDNSKPQESSWTRTQPTLTGAPQSNKNRIWQVETQHEPDGADTISFV